MIEPDIKIMDIDDLDILMTWRETVLREVFEMAGDEDISELLEENRRYYQQHLVDGSHIAVMAIVNDVPVGCGAVCLYDEMPSPDNKNGKCGFIMNMYTVPAHRRQGVAGAVVDWLTKAARKADTGKIYLETTDHAQSLYLEKGFERVPNYLIHRG